MDERARSVEQLATVDGIVIVRATGRRFPGVLVQGDTLWALLSDLEEEAPDSAACQRVRGWVNAYERFMDSRHWDLPYVR